MKTGGSARGLDLLLLPLSRDAGLLRAAHVAADELRREGLAVRLAEDLSVPDARGCWPPRQELQATARALASRTAPRAVALGACADSLERAFDAALGCGALPRYLFGWPFSMPGARARAVERCPGLAGVVAGPPGAPLTRALRGQAPAGGLDAGDGRFSPQPPRARPEEVVPSFRGADPERLRLEGVPVRLGSGCPRRCAHCAAQPCEGPLRTRPPELVARELALHRERLGARRFRFCDLALNGEPAALAELAARLRRDGPEVAWWGRALVDPALPAATYRELRLAGCVALELEVISGSDRVLARVGAGFSSDEAALALERAHGAGIACLVSLPVGLPGEDDAGREEQAAWLLRHGHLISRVQELAPFVPREGSAIERDPARYGVVPGDAERHDGGANTHAHRGDAERWHDGGANTHAHRVSWARELRVLVEDGLELEVRGAAPEAPRDPELRRATLARLRAGARAAELRGGGFRAARRQLAGALAGGPPLAGPELLEIDLTEACNQACAGCWIHSLLLGDDRLERRRRPASLPLDQLAALVQGARRLGTRHVQLSGAGEPYMHPQIDRALALIKGEDLELSLITNFTLVDEERARRLVDLGVDSLTISLWAGTAAGYAATHPTARADQFARVCASAAALTAYRRRTGAERPRVKIYNVISRLNYDELDAMIDTALAVGADLIELTPIDVVPGRTDELALGPDERERLIDRLLLLRQRRDYLQLTAAELAEGRLPGAEDGEHARFVDRGRLAPDFEFRLEDIRCWYSRCRRRLHSARVTERMRSECAIAFGQPTAECAACLALPGCSVDPVTHEVRVPFLSLQGFGSFWRRLRGGGGAHDAGVVDRVPCRVGYTYARVQATGRVIPCCKAAGLPLGDLATESFEEIWRSPGYQEFRVRALTSRKSDPYFAPIGCQRVCDNLGHNLRSEQQLAALSPGERAALLGGGRPAQS